MFKNTYQALSETVLLETIKNQIDVIYFKIKSTLDEVEDHPSNPKHLSY